MRTGRKRSKRKSSVLPGASSTHAAAIPAEADIMHKDQVAEIPGEVIEQAASSDAAAAGIRKQDAENAAKVTPTGIPLPPVMLTTPNTDDYKMTIAHCSDCAIMVAWIMGWNVMPDTNITFLGVNPDLAEQMGMTMIISPVGCQFWVSYDPETDTLFIMAEVTSEVILNEFNAILDEQALALLAEEAADGVGD
jgi:hypothetical protein